MKVPDDAEEIDSDVCGSECVGLWKGKDGTLYVAGYHFGPSGSAVFVIPPRTGAELICELDESVLVFITLMLTGGKADADDVRRHIQLARTMMGTSAPIGRHTPDIHPTMQADATSTTPAEPAKPLSDMASDNDRH